MNFLRLFPFLFILVSCGGGGGSSAAAPRMGQIVVDADHPAWLKYAGGGPHFMAGPGDPEDFLYRGTLNTDSTRNGDQRMLIDKLIPTGANSIYLQAVRSHGGDGDSTHNPFIDNDPAKGINNAILDQWESWFTQLDNNGIVILFFFYDDSALIWNTGDTVGAAERDFIQTIVDRFEHHNNLIWVVAEEYEEAYSAVRVSNIAAAIRAADARDRVIAVHKLNGLGFSEFADDPNIDQFAIQLDASSVPAIHIAMVTAWNNAAGKYNNNLAEPHNWGTGAIAQQKAWAVAMGGAYVMVLRMDIASTPIGDLHALGRLVRFMELTNFNEMAPHDELAFGGTEYVLASPGDSYIAYSSNLTSGSIGLRDMSAGSYGFLWYDTISGATVVQNNVAVGNGDQTWSKPNGMGNEVAVHIQRASAGDI